MLRETIVPSADPALEIPAGSGARFDRIHAALASLRHEERRLERLGLETPLARCRAQRRYWEFLSALFSCAGQDSVAGRPDGDDSWRGVGQE